MESTQIEVGALLRAAYDATTRAVSELGARNFECPTRAAGWTVRDLLFHQLCDAQRALIALASPSAVAPDVDAVSYWAPWKPGADGADAHAAFVRRAAAAYADPSALVDQWRATSAAVVRATDVALADGRGPIATQGHSITVADLASTLVVEATIHLLDLTLEVAGEPSAACLAHTRAVLEAILGDSLPAVWDDATAALKSTGRLDLDAVDRAALGNLGSLVSRLPLLG